MPSDSTTISSAPCYGTHAVGDDQHSFLLNQPGQRRLNQRFIFHVQAGSCLIQQNDGGILQKGPGDGNSLPFTAGERTAVFTDGRIPLVRKLFRKFIAVCKPCHGQDLFIRSILAAQADVFQNGVVKQGHILEDDGIQAHELFRVNFGNVHAAYGGEMKDVLQSVRYLTQDGDIVEAETAALDLSYRHSIFEENGGCILSAQFHLKRGDPDAIKARMNELMAKRVEKQPLDKPSAGSTFKRPAGAFAAALIDQCGLRGFRHGGAAVSEKHCGFVVNLGGATCADVLALCDEVRAIVKEKTGFDLEKEIRVVKA